MFVLRNATLSDLDDLLELASKVKFINLPNDPVEIEKKLKTSTISFQDPSDQLDDNYYFFVLEEVHTSSVIGVSMIHAQHGTQREPHFYLKVGSEHKFSQTINTGFSHGTLKLGIDTNGPTEIGGLVLHPDFRKSPEKLGKQISFVRFLYMAIYPDRFKPEVHSELMPPFDEKGQSLLWEAIGRRFLNMDYQEADRLSRSNKEFILSLYPAENIYMTLLPFEARDTIGKVGKETAPVKKMLEGIGFKYTNEVDPFDGGPHYRCKLSQIEPIKKFLNLPLSDENLEGKGDLYLLRLCSDDYDFMATCCEGKVERGRLKIKEEIKNQFKLKEGTNVFAIPF